MEMATIRIVYTATIVQIVDHFPEGSITWFFGGMRSRLDRSSGSHSIFFFLFFVQYVFFFIFIWWMKPFFFSCYYAVLGTSLFFTESAGNRIQQGRQLGDFFAICLRRKNGEYLMCWLVSIRIFMKLLRDLSPIAEAIIIIIFIVYCYWNWYSFIQALQNKISVKQFTYWIFMTHFVGIPISIPNLQIQVYICLYWSF